MATELSRGNLFNEVLLTDLIKKVAGKSTLAKLSAQKPIPFNGIEQFIFTMDSDIDIVAENGKKTHGGISLAPVKVVPIKVEYGARISDEFIFASDNAKIEILQAFNEGFATKVARGLDLMAIHGFNPRTKSVSDVVGTNYFDSLVTQTVDFKAENVEDNIADAVGLVLGNESNVTGLALSPTVSLALAKININGVRPYNNLAWGGNPDSLNGIRCDINTTISEGEGHDDVAIVGDFSNMFKWGIAKQIPLRVIEYGDPDNSGKDLQGYNQVYLRAETYLGWGIFDAKSFVRVKNAGESLG